MLDQKTQTQNEINWDEVNNPPEKSYDLFGKIEINFWLGAYQKGTRGSVPFDPAIHEKSHTAIDIFIQPLPEINVRYPKSLECRITSWDRAWGKIIIPSLKALGTNDAREINGKWARVAKVPDGGSYQRKDKATGDLMYKPDGSPDMVETTCFKFVAFFADENECRAAYLAAGGQPGNGHNAPTLSAEDAERIQARNIMTVVINNVAPGKTKFAEVQEAIKAHAFYPHISKYYPADSVETGELITEVTKLLPF